MTIDGRCQTHSGPHRCIHSLGHKGPCEAQAREYAISFDKPCGSCGKRIGDHVVDGPRLRCPT